MIYLFELFFLYFIPEKKLIVDSTGFGYRECPDAYWQPAGFGRCISVSGEGPCKGSAES